MAGDHLGDRNRGIVGEGGRKGGLHLRLAQVVAFLGEALPELPRDRLAIDRAGQRSQRREPRHTTQVVVEGARDVGVLDLHRDRLIVDPSAVHLADGRGRDRLELEGTEALLERRPHRGFDRLPHRIGRHAALPRL